MGWTWGGGGGEGGPPPYNFLDYPSQFSFPDLFPASLHCAIFPLYFDIIVEATSFYTTGL